MKKLNKLFAILIAVLGVGSLSAQTDVTSTYLTNADFESEYSTFWTGSERAIFQPEGWTVVRTNGNDNDMSILCSTDVANGSFSAWTINDESTRGKKTYWTRLRWGGQVWNWNGTTGKPTDLQLQQEMKQLPEGVYRLSADLLSYAHGTEANNHTYLIATNTTTNRGVSVEPTINHTKSDNNWENKSVLIPSSGTTNYKVTLQCLQNWQGSGEYISGFDNVKLEKIVVSSENPVDLTAFVGSAQGDWTGAGGTYSNCVEHFIWGGTATGEYLSQIVTDLPMGLYEVVMYCASSSTSSRDNEGATPVDEGDTRYVTLSANNSSVGIPSYNRISIEGDIPSYTLTNVKVTDGTLKLLVNINEANPNWIVANIKSLTYLGPDLSTYKEALSEALTKANNFDKTSIPSAMASQLESAISNGENVEQTMEALQQATEQLNLILNVAENSQALYTDLKNLITQCNTYASNSYSNVQDEAQRTTFTTAITTANTNGNKATTVAELTEVYNTLEAARQTFVLVAYPTSGNSFDMTFKILNAEIISKDNWETNANLASNVDYTNAPDIYALDRWDAGSTNGTTVYAKQTINNLANGVYTLTAMARGNGADMYYVYATSNDIEYKEVVIGGGNTGNPWGLVTVPNIVVVNGGSMELGLKGTNNNTWFSVDNFKLYRSYDVTAMQSVLTDLLTGANTMASKPMNATIKGALNSTIQATDATATDPATLDNMINALNEAMASAESSINDYAKLKKYIDMTAVFTDVTSYTTKYNNGEYASTDVEATRQELNVLRFEAASLIFPNNIEVTGWEGTMGGKNTGGQHWDGTTGENATKYYDNNSWNGNAHSTTTNITLPAGNYVLKAALRSNENTTLKLTVLDETVNVEGKGDQGYGITINGTASFSPDSTYANDNNGRGWEWEFVKFELADETTVTLTVECDYNGVYGWASFSDITLWMDDATYLTVYGKELDAPLAEAKNLVNTLPMGDAEKAALADAIELGEGEISKPAQLNTAVDALKEAVANANDWRSTYNTEKDKLVAALERFETEFNDGANGALRFIVEWDGLLTAVAEAACAKDITNSYDRFSNAAAALNAAMDAVFEDYLKYEMLEDYTSVIGNADCASNDAWPGSGRANDTKEHWSGTEKTYFKQNHENGAARTQTVTLPKSGTYLLKAAVRAVEAASYVDIIINGKSHKIMGAHGRTGGTIATDGTEWESVAAGIEAGKTFANGNKGYGWVYQYIYFDAEVGENTIAISLSNYNNNREANVGGMTLYYLRPNYTIRENNIVKHYGEYTESITAVHTTHDVTNATMSSLAVNVTATPNTLIIANEGQVNNESNVIINGTANQLLLTDGYAFNATTNFTANEVSYEREFTKDTWLTVCLPFAYPIPENVKVETLGAIDLDTKTFTFDEVTGTMEANTPYLIKNSTETAALFASLGDVEVEATPAAMNVPITADNSEHQGEFIGTYTTVKTDALMEDGTYDILFFGTDGQLYYLSQGVTTKNITIKPFRAYIRLPKDAINWSDGQQARVRHRNSAMTDIEGSVLDTQGSVLIYDLMGRRVTAIEKGGIYIVNGKKVTVR